MSTGYDQIVADNLARARDRIATACAHASRQVDAVRLIAVSKTHPVAAVLAAMQAGQRHFGENRIQEAQSKFAALRDIATDAAPFLHLIGPIQTNKLRDALACADAIDTLDRPRLLEALIRQMPDPATAPRLLVQINVDDEPQKAGIARKDADPFIQDCRAHFGDRLQGLMCIPTAGTDPRAAFAWLAECAAKHGLEQLSMGMSADYETAIACGATEIRLGTALFGTREIPHE